MTVRGATIAALLVAGVLMVLFFTFVTLFTAGGAETRCENPHPVTRIQRQARRSREGSGWTAAGVSGASRSESRVSCDTN